MSLNKIELKPKAIVDLYQNVLTETTAMNVPKEDIKLLGNATSQILILLKNAHYPFISDNELIFLSSVLTACKLSMNDVAVLNLYTINEPEKKLSGISFKNAILFDILPLQIGLPIDFPQFQIQQFDQRTYLHVPSLIEIENDKPLKLQLWNCLKKMFSL